MPPPSPPLGTTTLGCSLLLPPGEDHHAPKGGVEAAGCCGSPRHTGTSTARRMRHGHRRSHTLPKAVPQPRAGTCCAIQPSPQAEYLNCQKKKKAKKLFTRQKAPALRVPRQAKHPISQARGCSGVCRSHQRSRGSGTGLGAVGSTAKQGHLWPFRAGQQPTSHPSPLLRGREGSQGLTGDAGCWLPGEGGQTRTYSLLRVGERQSCSLCPHSRMPPRGTWW